MSDITRYELLDGPSDLSRCYYTRGELAAVIRQHPLPGSTRVVNLRTRAIGTIAQWYPDELRITPKTSERFIDTAAMATQTQVGQADTQVGQADTVVTDRVSRPFVAPDEIPTGTRWGDIEFGTVLGRGGMGVVYRGTLHGEVGAMPIAIKVLPAGQENDRGSIKRFHREGETLAKIDSPYVVRVYRRDQHMGRHYIAMELVPGKSLADMLTDNFHPSVREACSMIAQAAMGLHAAGVTGIVHRDVKPGNLLVDTQEKLIKITDFGIARFARGGDNQNLTLPGAIVGTANYISPEQANAEGADHRSDLYSLGVVFYELLAGHLPFRGNRTEQVLKGHRKEPPPPLPGHLPPAVIDVVYRLLLKDPSARYQSGHELAKELDDIIAELDGPAPASPVKDERTSVTEPLATGEPVAKRRQITPLPEPQPAPPPRGAGIAIFVALVCTGSLVIGGWWLAMQQATTPTIPTPTTSPTTDEQPTPPTANPIVPAPPSREELRNHYFDAYQTGDWQTAHGLAQEYQRRFPHAADRDEVFVPVRIDIPAQATCYADGAVLAEQSTTIDLRHGQTRQVLLIAPGHQPLALTIDGSSWRVAPELTSLPALRWSNVLPGQPTGAGCALPGQLAIGTTRGIQLLQADDGTSYDAGLAPEELGPAPIVGRCDQGLAVCGSERIALIDPSHRRPLWEHASPALEPTPLRLAPHELLDQAHLAYLAHERTISAFLHHHHQLRPLVSTALPAPAAFAPVCIDLGPGASLLVQPLADRLLIYDSSLIDAETPLRLLGEHTLSRPLVTAPQLLIVDGAPGIALTTDGGNGYLIGLDPSDPAATSVRSNWHLGLNAAWPATPTGDQRRLLYGLKNGEVVCIDLDDHSRERWRWRAASGPLAGPPQIVDGLVLASEANGTIHALALADGGERWRLATGLTLADAARACDDTIIAVGRHGIAMGIDSAAMTAAR